MDFKSRRYIFLVNRGVCSKGASLVEAAIVIPIFLSLIIAFIDFVRYFGTYISQNYKVHQVLEVATKIRMDIDLEQSSPELIDEFKRGIELALKKADGPVANLWTTPFYQSSSIQAVGFQLRFGAPLSEPPPFTSQVALLRPGEEAFLINEDGEVTSENVDHPYRSASTGPPTGLESWSSVLASYPLVVYSKTKFDFIVPFIPSQVITAIAVGYNHHKQAGTSQLSPFPYTSPTPKKWPDTPTPPGGQPTLTPTATPGSGTATPTATPTLVPAICLAQCVPCQQTETCLKDCNCCWQVCPSCQNNPPAVCIQNCNCSGG